MYSSRKHSWRKTLHDVVGNLLPWLGMFFLSSSLPHFMSSYFILFLCTKEALQFLSLDGNRVISVKCSENVSERHRRAFDRRVTVRQVLTTLGIFLVASSLRRVVMSCRVWLCFALFCVIQGLIVICDLIRCSFRSLTNFWNNCLRQLLRLPKEHAGSVWSGSKLVQRGKIYLRIGLNI